MDDDTTRAEQRLIVSLSDFPALSVSLVARSRPGPQMGRNLEIAGKFAVHRAVN